jgi:RNA polymerase sigma-70 factor (ECF subfamily)
MNTNAKGVDIETLYRECYTPVFRYLYFRTKDYDIATDLTQNSFLKYMRQVDKGRDADYARRLLFVIARTALIDHYRSSARRKRSSIDDVPEIVDETINQQDDAIRKEDAEYLNLVLKDLSEQESDIVSMRIAGVVDYKTIASTLDIPEQNARKIYSRAIQKVGTIIKASGRF